MIGVIGRLCLLKGELSVPAWMFDAFAKKRVAVSATLVKIILKDVQKYDTELAVQIKRPGGAPAVTKLAEATSDDAILHQTVKSGGTGIVTKAWIKETAAAATASAAPDTSASTASNRSLAAAPSVVVSKPACAHRACACAAAARAGV